MSSSLQPHHHPGLHARLTSADNAVSDEPIAFSECQVVLPLFTHFLSVAQYRDEPGVTVTVSKSL